MRHFYTWDYNAKQTHLGIDDDQAQRQATMLELKSNHLSSGHHTFWPTNRSPTNRRKAPQLFVYLPNCILTIITVSKKVNIEQQQQKIYTKRTNWNCLRHSLDLRTVLDVPLKSSIGIFKMIDHFNTIIVKAAQASKPKKKDSKRQEFLVIVKFKVEEKNKIKKSI